MGIQQLVQQSDLSSPVQWDDVFREKHENFMGHTLRIVTLTYFPFIDFEERNTDGDSPIYLSDCLDARILNTFSAHLNFTYKIHEPWDGAWGVPLVGGNWSGIVGMLQHHKADFSLNLTPTPSRMKVISHSRIYTRDPFLIMSLKPKLLPRHSALLRPFTGDLWIMVIVFTSVAGVVLWLLQRTWFWVSGDRGIRLYPALLYSWGVLLQEPVTYSSTNISDQVFVGWWLLFSLVIDTAYRSALIAHLSVQSKELPINTFDDLLNRQGWSWGSRPLQGTDFLYFNQTTDPIVREIYKNMPAYEIPEGMRLLTTGGFSYIMKKTRTRTKIAPLYQDRYGNSPFHISTTKYPVFGGNSWGIRSCTLVAICQSLTCLTWVDQVSVAGENNAGGSIVFSLNTLDNAGGSIVFSLNTLDNAGGSIVFSLNTLDNAGGSIVFSLNTLDNAGGSIVFSLNTLDNAGGSIVFSLNTLDNAGGSIVFSLNTLDNAGGSIVFSLVTLKIMLEVA
ncbi:glutamate receptor ionotropic, delta-1-like [Panulirus ornatus]|uniref:glutamate receptor ionotropic, delta-1-like n=1 Tax=Panulirus ornatus TaxID=150431 RepID=UPI003A85010A